MMINFNRMTMMKMKQLLMLAAVVALCGMMAGCKGDKAQRPVNGTLEEAVKIGDYPVAVGDVMKQADIDDRYETVMEDKTAGVSVYSLLKCFRTKVTAWSLSRTM